LILFAAIIASWWLTTVIKVMKLFMKKSGDRIATWRPPEITPTDLQMAFQVYLSVLCLFSSLISHLAFRKLENIYEKWQLSLTNTHKSRFLGWRSFYFYCSFSHFCAVNFLFFFLCVFGLCSTWRLFKNSRKIIAQQLCVWVGGRSSREMWENRIN